MSLETIVIIIGVLVVSCLYSIYKRLASLDDNFHNWYVDWNNWEERYNKNAQEDYARKTLNEN